MFFEARMNCTWNVTWSMGGGTCTWNVCWSTEKLLQMLLEAWIYCTWIVFEARINCTWIVTWSTVNLYLECYLKHAGTALEMFLEARSNYFKCFFEAQRNCIELSFNTHEPYLKCYLKDWETVLEIYVEEQNKTVFEMCVEAQKNGTWNVTWGMDKLYLKYFVMFMETLLEIFLKHGVTALGPFSWPLVPIASIFRKIGSFV